jgi:hypothetical protein
MNKKIISFDWYYTKKLLTLVGSSNLSQTAELRAFDTLLRHIFYWQVDLLRSEVYFPVVHTFSFFLFAVLTGKNKRAPMNWFHHALSQ